MKIQRLRKLIQVGALLLLFLIPILQSYKSFLVLTPNFEMGSLWEHAQEFKHLNPEINGGFLSNPVIALDFLVGTITSNLFVVTRLLDGFNGYYWSITVGGIPVIDPLAGLQNFRIDPILSVSWMVAFIIPIIIALLVGRIFCSWICPINTCQEMCRYATKKVVERLPHKTLIQGNYRRMLLFGGILITFSGIIVFPFILPYAVLGRLISNLSMGVVLWHGIVFITLVLVADSFLEKGIWCNKLCPTGALLDLISRRRLFGIKYDADRCLNSNTTDSSCYTCSVCTKVCSWESDPKQGTNHNCTNCHQCIDKCPQKALKISKYYRNKRKTTE